MSDDKKVPSKDIDKLPNDIEKPIQETDKSNEVRDRLNDQQV